MKNIDMTKGPITGAMLRFALPLMLSGILQLLYAFFDGLIVGRLLGVDAFAAVGATGALNWFPQSVIMSAGHGFSVLLAQRFGAGDSGGLRRAFVMSCYLTIAVSLTCTFVGVPNAERFLTALNTPGELGGMAAAYMRASWWGLTLVGLYNAGACALRAVGDGRTPLFALILSTCLNIALDYLLIGGFGMGVEGAAIATVIAQAVAAAYCFRGALRIKALRPEKGDFAPDAPTIKKLIKLGAPPLLSEAVIAAGGLPVQAAINAQGVSFVTGISVSRRYYELLNVCGSALEGVLATFVGQNAGARNIERMKAGIKKALTMGVVTAAVTAALVYVFAGNLITLYLGEPNATGELALRARAGFLIALYVLCMCRAAAQAMGSAITPMVCGFTELAVRLGCTAVAAAAAIPALLCFADTTGWLVGAAAAIFLMLRVLKKNSNRPRRRVNCDCMNPGRFGGAQSSKPVLGGRFQCLLEKGEGDHAGRNSA